MNRLKTNPENRFSSDFTEQDFTNVLKDFFAGIVIIATGVLALMLIILIN
jgi:hypothetical protein